MSVERLSLDDLRVVLSLADFRDLVSGKSISLPLQFGLSSRSVEVALADIGYSVMLATIDEARRAAELRGGSEGGV